MPGNTVIVDQGEKLSLKETLTLLDGAARHNVQVLITDSGQRTGTGSALMAMKDAGVNTYRWQGGEQRPATIISEPDRNVRYARLAGDFAASVKAGEESVAQVSGVREQAILTQAIRSELKTQGVLGRPEVTMTALSPVWLDSRSRYLRDMYRPGMVMEQWNPETRSHDRYVIDRVSGMFCCLPLRMRLQKPGLQRLLLIIVDSVRVKGNEVVWFRQCRPKILFQLSIGQKSRYVLIISV